MELLVELLSGAAGAALVAGIFTVAQKRSAKKDAKSKALRYIMLYIIQERGKQHIKDGKITMEDRRALHHWHDLYHNGLGGNGDADALMAQVDRLQLDTEY
jgi:hypothetical protein